MPRLLIQSPKDSNEGFHRIKARANCIKVQLGWALFCFLLFPTLCPAQSVFESFENKNPVEALVRIEAFPDREKVASGKMFQFYVIVQLPEKWHIYSLHQKHEGDEVATRVQLKSGDFEAISSWQESKPRMFQDEVLGHMMMVHSDRAEFSISLQSRPDLKPGSYPLSGTLTYRTCDNRVCSLPLEKPFRSHVIVEGK